MTFPSSSLPVFSTLVILCSCSFNEQHWLYSLHPSYQQGAHLIVMCHCCTVSVQTGRVRLADKYCTHWILMSTKWIPVGYQCNCYWCPIEMDRVGWRNYACKSFNFLQTLWRLPAGYSSPLPGPCREASSWWKVRAKPKNYKTFLVFKALWHKNFVL